MKKVYIIAFCGLIGVFSTVDFAWGIGQKYLFATADLYAMSTGETPVFNDGVSVNIISDLVKDHSVSGASAIIFMTLFVTMCMMWYRDIKLQLAQKDSIIAKERQRNEEKDAVIANKDNEIKTLTSRLARLEGKFEVIEKGENRETAEKR